MATFGQFTFGLEYFGETISSSGTPDPTADFTASNPLTISDYRTSQRPRMVMAGPWQNTISGTPKFPPLGSTLTAYVKDVNGGPQTLSGANDILWQVVTASGSILSPAFQVFNDVGLNIGVVGVVIPTGLDPGNIRGLFSFSLGGRRRVGFEMFGSVLAAAAY